MTKPSKHTKRHGKTSRKHRKHLSKRSRKQNNIKRVSRRTLKNKNKYIGGGLEDMPSYISNIEKYREKWKKQYNYFYNLYFDTSNNSNNNANQEEYADKYATKKATDIVNQYILTEIPEKNNSAYSSSGNKSSTENNTEEENVYINPENPNNVGFKSRYGNQSSATTNNNNTNKKNKFSTLTKRVIGVRKAFRKTKPNTIINKNKYRNRKNESFFSNNQTIFGEYNHPLFKGRNAVEPNQSSNEEIEEPPTIINEDIYGTSEDYGYTTPKPAPRDEYIEVSPETQPTSSKKTILVFDFDQTFIAGHSGGIPYNKDGQLKSGLKNYELIEPLDKFYINSLQDLKDNYGVRDIYINSRGIVKDGQIDKFLAPLVTAGIINAENIIGANNQAEIGNPTGMMREPYLTEVSKLSNDNSWPENAWAIMKSQILDDIKQKEGVNKDDIYFFDDTRKNIIMAKETFGFINSKIVNVNSKNSIDTNNIPQVDLAGSGLELFGQIKMLLGPQQ